ncbi:MULTISPECIES: hypothetical protein [Tissierellales]|uniref:Uncharacterized protein n=1 Tax=Acidilutibacter cellobiosedens TaxID=2507161 RepID=A0A410QAW2_9FIRM|nr:MULTISPECIES: hypothetical protein [Tissierellales]MBE6082482.1 hypothetical protein [Tissierellaceae bacterium]QAT61141.1 hypothetical protein EQM13_05840 [Acidilutibacter cellobiosedens]
MELANDEKSGVTNAFVVTKKLTDYGICRQKTKVPVLKIPALPLLYLLGKIEADRNNDKI